MNIPEEKWCHEMSLPFIYYFTNFSSIRVLRPARLHRSGTTKRDAAHWWSLPKKRRISHWAPSPTSLSLEDKYFADLAPFFTNLRGSFGGEGVARLWWELLPFSKTRADCKGAGWVFEPFPADSRLHLCSVERKSDFFSRRSLHVALGKPRVVGRVRGGARPGSGPTLGAQHRWEGQERGPGSGGAHWTPERGLSGGEVACTVAGSNHGHALEPAAKPATRRARSAPVSPGRGPGALLGLPWRSGRARGAVLGLGRVPTSSPGLAAPGQRTPLQDPECESGDPGPPVAKRDLHFTFRFGEYVTGRGGEGKKKRNCKYDFEGGEGRACARGWGGAAAWAPGGDSRSRSAP